MCGRRWDWGLDSAAYRLGLPPIVGLQLQYFRISITRVLVLVSLTINTTGSAIEV